MLKSILKAVLTIAALAGAGWVGLELRDRLREDGAEAGRTAERPPAPVEVAEIARGDLVQRRTISGTLEASSEFVVAPKTSGRVVELGVDLSDPVRRGEVVARLDDAEAVQAVAQADADLAVARAQLAEAVGALEIAERTLARVRLLRERQMAAEIELDAALSDHVTRKAQVEVARARVTRAEASVEAAKIRLGYSSVIADWSDGDDERVVAERFVDEGETVSANAPLYRVVDLDPIVGVVFVPERDYARLHVGQPVVLTTDAYPADRFEGTIERIAPVFRESTRQARVELRIENGRRELKPGMFIRATVELDRVEDAVVVPFAALTERKGATGVFLLDADGRHVRWRPVRVGVKEAARVQIVPVDGEPPAGRVVVLGQHLVDDGSEVVIPGEAGPGADGAASVE